MPKDYEESKKLFIDFLTAQIESNKEKLKNLEYYDRIKKIYKELKSKNYTRFIDYYELLSKISPSIKEDLDIIDFLVKNNIPNTPQMELSINSILENRELLKIVSNNDTKEMLQGQIEAFESIISGKYDFETFKNALLDSNLDTNSIISILTHEAVKSTKIDKKQLPSLDEVNEVNTESIKKHDEIIKKVNKLIDKYYHLIESKPANLLDMYRKTISASNMLEINNYYQEKDVVLCMHILHLIDLKNEGEELLNAKPVDYELLDVNTDELTEAYEYALEASKEYEKIQRESLPLDSTLYFTLEDGNPLFNLDDFSSEEKKNIDAMIRDLEMGLFDYERSKHAHTIVKQNIRRDLNVFVNKKRNLAVSYIRINSSDLKDSKVLVLNISPAKSIFDSSQTTLKTKSSLIDDSISKILESNPEFESTEQSFKDKLKEELTDKEVSLS